jgi:hypothetical protein
MHGRRGSGWSWRGDAVCRKGTARAWITSRSLIKSGEAEKPLLFKTRTLFLVADIEAIPVAIIILLSKAFVIFLPNAKLLFPILLIVEPTLQLP